MVTVEINQTAGRKVDENFIRNVVGSFLKYFKVKKGELSVAIVSEEEIKKLNYRYRNRDYPTDVLSFLYEETPLEGEVVICYETARKQAKQEGYPLQEEIKNLLVHGLVHLKGYDHKTKKEREEMRKIEEEIKDKV